MLLGACTGNDIEDANNTTNNLAPIAAIQVSTSSTQVNASVSLNGSQSSDPEGASLTYQWQIISGPNGGLIQNQNAVNASFQANQAGSYTIQLAISDGRNTTTTTVVIDVTTSSGNSSPTAQAGVDQTTSTGQTITLDGSGSSDPDGNALSYSWQVTSAPANANFSFGTSTSAQTSFTANTGGQYIIQLSVSDGSASTTDTLTITVNASNTGNNAPTANAGSDQILTLGQTVTLDGTGSSDPDGDSLSFSWTVQSQPTGGNGRFGNATAANTTFVGDIAGTYVLLLTVNDGAVSSQDTVSIQLFESTPTVDSPNLSFSLASVEILPGGWIEYQITVANPSTADILSNAELTMLVPNEVNYFVENTSAEPDASGCGQQRFCEPGDMAYWGLGDIEPGASQTINVVALAESNLVTGSSFETTVQLDANNLAETASATRLARVVDERAIHLTLTPSRDAVSPEKDFRYLVSVGNASTGAISNGQLILTLPEGVSPSAASDSGAINGNAIVWSFGNLFAGNTLQRVVDVNLPSNVAVGSTLTAVAQLRHDGGPAIDREVFSPISVSAPLDLAVSYDILQSEVTSEGRINYQISVSNTSSTSVVPNAVVMLRPPVEVNYFLEHTDAEPDASDCGQQRFCDSGDEARWALGDISPGQSVTIDISARTDSGLRSGTLIETPITVTANGLGDVIYERRTARVTDVKDVRMTLSPSRDAISPGTNLSYEISVGNGSNGAINNGKIEATLPPGVTATNVSDGGNVVGQTVTWAFANLLTGASLQRTVDARLDSNVAEGATLTASARLSYDSGSAIDREVHSPISVSKPQNLEVTFTPQESALSQGRLPYSIEVHNTALLSVIPNVVVVLRVPPEINYFLEHTDAEPDASDCGQQRFCDSGDEARWALGDLSPGQTVNISIDALLDQLPVGTLIETPITITANDLGDTLIERRTTRVVSP